MFIQRDGKMFIDCQVNAACIFMKVKNHQVHRTIVAQCLNGAGKELPQENE